MDTTRLSEMHSSVEGEELGTVDVLLELGTLIVEGRIPGGATGYAAGPHCGCARPGPSLAQPMRHVCKPDNFLCKREENFRKQMVLLWQNGIPMCVEVLLCPDCSCGLHRSTAAEATPAPTAEDILLEQWLVTVVPKRPPEIQASPWTLLQAVRSHLHFSQLSAWWSNSGGKSPRHVAYRITVPGEDFASRFSRPPIEHHFPVAYVTRGSSFISVSVRSHPRSEAVPRSLCPTHCGSDKLDSVEDSSSDGAAGPFPPGCRKDDGRKRSCESDLRRSLAHARFSGSPSNEGPPLGESLLDPPPSLELLPRRYQSPSRCGSPSIEAPDHLLVFRSSRRPSFSGKPINDPVHDVRTGRQGMPRKRDLAPWPSPSSDIVDDRMQTACTQPGKHHCCHGDDLDLTDEDDEDKAQLSRRASSSFSYAKYLPSSLSRPGGSHDSPFAQPLGHEEKSLFCDDSDEKWKKNELLSEKGHSQHHLAKMTVDSKSPSAGHFDSSAMPSCSKSLKDVDKSKAALNLELTREEVEEVLAVLRKRNTTPVSKRSKESSVDESSSTICHLKSELIGGAHSQSHEVYDVEVPSTVNSCASTTGKADLLLEAILRSSGKVASRCEKDSVLSGKCQSKNRRTSEILLGEEFDLDLCKAKNDTANYTTITGSNGASGSALPSLAKSNNVILKSAEDLNASDRVLDDLLPKGDGSKSSLPESINKEVIMKSSNACDINSRIALRDSEFLVKENEADSIKGNKDYHQQCSKSCSSSDILRRISTKVQLTVRSAISEKVPLRKRRAFPNSPLTLNISHARKSVTTQKVERSSDTTLQATQTALEDVSEGCSQDDDDDDSCTCWSIPSAKDKARFRRSLDSAASMVFHSKTGLPLTSSPAPIRKGTRFDFDSSLNTVSAIRSALFDSPLSNELDGEVEVDECERSPNSSHFYLSTSWPSSVVSSSLLGSFEESVLNGRLEPVSTVQGFVAEIGASGAFCPRHQRLPVTAFFYTIGDNDKVSTPYLGHINLGKKGYTVPRTGTVQVTLFNPLGTVVKMFVVLYDLMDMPANSQTFLRQRTYYMPAVDSDADCHKQKWLRYLIHLRFASSKSGRIYLHSDIRMIIFRKSDLDTATAHNIEKAYELRSFTSGPTNPKFSPRK